MISFQIIGAINDVETIASGSGIQILSVLQKRYGSGKWRKRKGTALVRLRNDTVRYAEIHWFEAHGIGKKKIRIKRFLD